jgi:hypothetical protein
MHREGRTELPHRELNILFIGKLSGLIPHCLSENVRAPTETSRNRVSVRRKRRLDPRDEQYEKVSSNIFKKAALTLAGLEVLR